MNKTLSYILIISFLNIVGCYSSKSVNKEILYTSDLGEPSGVVTIITNKDKKLVVYEGNYDLVGDTLHITGMKLHRNFKEHIDVNIALDDIQYVEIEEIDDLATTGCVVGLTALAIIIIIAIASAYSIDNSPKKCSGPEGFGFEEG